MNKILLLILFFTNTYVIAKAKALDIDEKLTIRILEASNSKRTLLLNRGHEDGIVVNTHAKFFLSTGVFARGVSRKVSPARSIWSIYRIVKPEHIVVNKVANIKISTPIKLTDDPSQAIVVQNRKYEMGEPKDINPASEISKEEDMKLDPNDSSELGALLSDSNEIEATPRMTRSSVSTDGHHIELATLVSFSSLSGTETTGATDSTDSSSVDSELSSFDLTISAEKLFPNTKSFLRHIGLRGLVQLQSDSNGTSEIKETSNFNIGGGASYYFQDPFIKGKPIFYLDGSFGMISSTVSTTDTVNSDNNEEAEGSGSFVSFGIGLKYLASDMFGFTGKLEYYSATTSFDFEESSGDIRTDEIELSGPQVQFGLFMRFF